MSTPKKGWVTLSCCACGGEAPRLMSEMLRALRAGRMLKVYCSRECAQGALVGKVWRHK
jgi:hypothetical protein